MIKELKYLFYIFTIFLFFFVTIKFYISDENKKISYRKFQLIEKKVEDAAKKLPLLKNDTENIIEYVENTVNKDKKKFYFWELLKND
tara:strand:- start:373 stop:633 length:261 start_codon:yes stop_codon:yes gene_type:complete